MKLIPLTRGQYAMVDDEDYEALSRFSWHAVPHGASWEVRRKTVDLSGRTSTGYMSRLLMEPPRGAVVDHIDGNGLNNQRSNLRVCTQAQNTCNTARSSKNTSGYKGVHRTSGAKTWVAAIRHHGVRHYLGTFNTPEDAASAYDAASKRLHGEFARPNRPGPTAKVMRNPSCRTGASGFKGVTKNTISRNWSATIVSHGRFLHLGSYPTKEAAAKAYDRAAVQMGRDLASLNFPQEVSA